MSEADKTYGKCPNCGNKSYLTGIWASGNPTLANGKKACVDCKMHDIYARFFEGRKD
jgi:hypothetical protein